MGKTSENREPAKLLVASAALMFLVLLLFVAMSRREERSPEEVYRGDCREITKWELPESAHFTDEETRYRGGDSYGKGELAKTLFHLKLDSAGYDLLAGQAQCGEPADRQRNEALDELEAYYPESMLPDPSTWKIAYGGTVTGDAASLYYNEQTGDALLLLNDQM